jgi:hypothetical protein
MPAYTRDPVSELLDDGARTLLERAFAARGGWVQTRLADPSPQHVAWAASIGIDLWGPDNAPTVSGRHKDLKTRWVRSFSRALHYQLKWYGSPGRMRRSRRMVKYDRALELEVGRRVPALGVIPAGRIVRIRLLSGGRAAYAAVQATPMRNRIIDEHGNPDGPVSSVAEGRDWA